jgi:hypothetical protein
VDSGERKLTNKNYKYKNRLESGKQVIGPISAQTLVDLASYLTFGTPCTRVGSVLFSPHNISCTREVNSQCSLPFMVMRI